MKDILKNLQIAICLIFINSCNSTIIPKENNLIGEYAAKRGGRSEIKIIKERDTFFITMLSKEKWEKPVPLEIAKEKELEKLFGKNYKTEVKSGLYREGIAIFEIDKEAVSKNGNVKYDSDYFFYYVLTGGSIYKVK